MLWSHIAQKGQSYHSNNHFSYQAASLGVCTAREVLQFIILDVEGNVMVSGVVGTWCSVKMLWQHCHMPKVQRFLYNSMLGGCGGVQEERGGRDGNEKRPTVTCCTECLAQRGWGKSEGRNCGPGELRLEGPEFLLQQRAILPPCTIPARALILLVCL